jgi:hypothetical protein
MGLRAAHGAKCLRGPLCYEERGKYARELAAFTRDLSEAADYRRKPFNPYILDEVARLKASRAVHYRGGIPMVRIEPEDIPGKILGPGYTPEDVWELARRRVLERGGR